LFAQTGDDALAHAVGRVLPTAFAEAISDVRLGQVLAPALEKATQSSIRSDPQRLVNILYPLIVPAIANPGAPSPWNFGPAVVVEEELLAWVGWDAETALHPSCTCRMGVGEDSVIDPATMRVHGLDGLRVVDASAMRYVTNGNIYAPTMMTAEKAADLILGNTPLEPIEIDFYRHHGEVGHEDSRTADIPTPAASLTQFDN